MPRNVWTKTADAEMARKAELAFEEASMKILTDISKRLVPRECSVTDIVMPH
jgi:hypothetical protein